MTYLSIEAAIVRQNAADHNYNTARALLATLVKAGRVAYEEADKHNGGTAKVLVDGEPVGQASSLLVGMDYATTKLVENLR